MHRSLEVCVTDFESARAAAAGGADRVELCADIVSGGITPSAGMIAKVVAELPIPIHVLIRPRGGHFVYRADELDVMAADIDIVKSLGGAGIVVGVLKTDGGIDREAMVQLIDRARPLSVTFHKAIDLTHSPVDSVDVLISMGVDRVLTSGGLGPCRDFLPTLNRMIERARGQIVVMVGGGIRESDLITVIEATGAAEFHLGSGVCMRSESAQTWGVPPAQVDVEKVRRVVRLIRSES